MFLQCEQFCWLEIVDLLNRIPLTDRNISDNCMILNKLIEL